MWMKIEALVIFCADAFENAEKFETADYKMFMRQRKSERAEA